MATLLSSPLSCQRSILQFGNACRSFFTPSSVTLVRCSESVVSFLKPLRCSSPASVVLGRPQVEHLKLGQTSEVKQSCVRHARAPQLQDRECRQTFQMFQPGVRDLRIP